MLLTKTKLNTIKVLISKVLSDSHINHGESVSIHNLLRKYNEIKRKSKILKILCNIPYKNNGTVLHKF